MWLHCIFHSERAFQNIGSIRDMMTSSNGNIFRVTGPLYGEFTGPRWIPRTKPVTELWCFLSHRCLNKRLSKQSRRWWFETPSCSLWRHCNDLTINPANYAHGSRFVVFCCVLLCFVVYVSFGCVLLWLGTDQFYPQASGLLHGTLPNEITLIDYEEYGRVSNHRQTDCLFNSLFRPAQKNQSSAIIAHCQGNKFGLYCY